MCFFVAGAVVAGSAITAATLAADAGIILTAVSTALSVSAQVGQAGAASDAAKANQENAEAAAVASSNAAFRAASNRTREGATLAATQRAAAASTGFAVDQGDFLRITTDTALRTARDVTAIQESGAQDSYAYSLQAANFKTERKNIQGNLGGQIAGTVIGGASRVAGAWYAFGGSGGFSSPSPGGSGLTSGGAFPGNSFKPAAGIPYRSNYVTR